MKRLHAFRTIALVVFLSPGFALGQEAPEAVYAKLHRATLSGDSDAALGFATAKQKADLVSKPKAERDAIIQFIGQMMPKSYTLTGTVVSTDGNSAVVRGTGASSLPGGGPMYLTANFLKEAGEWKADQWGWSSDKPPATAPQAAPAPKRAVAVAKVATPKPAAPKPAGELPAAAVVRSAAPRTECAYKPVMTGDDMKACGIAVR